MKSVYDSLTDDEKRLVTPGRTVYGDFPKTLAARSVKYIGGDPVGFADIYGPFNLHRNRPKYVVNVAVKDGFRGNGIASSMAREAVKKVARQIVANRNDAKKRGLVVKNEPDEILWEFVRGNDKSERAAGKAGFSRIGRGRYALGIDDAISMSKSASLGKVIDWLGRLRGTK